VDRNRKLCVNCQNCYYHSHNYESCKRFFEIFLKTAKTAEVIYSLRRFRRRRPRAVWIPPNSAAVEK
jgi:hypothetical protein